MALYAIGDLHLSFGTDKPMDIFGAVWEKHYDKIKENWLAVVKPEDTVIIPGDISWSITFEGAKIDLEWIDQLPGRKIIFKGNHDFWWVSKSKMNNQYETIEFMHNNYSTYEDYAICGTRGWLCPNDVLFTDADEKIYKREAIRLENSILLAKKEDYKKIIGVLHYPPTNDKKETSLFTEIFEKYEVEQVIYGHVHSKTNFKYALVGSFQGVDYQLTSCDYLNFTLYLLIE